jgi:hypothetical protein
MIIGPITCGIAALTLPQYARHRRGAMDNAAESAYHHVQIAEEAYFFENETYTTDYNALIERAALTIYKDVDYSPIELCITNGVPGYKFSVKHNQSSNYYRIDTCAENIVTQKSLY